MKRLIIFITLISCVFLAGSTAKAINNSQDCGTGATHNLAGNLDSLNCVCQPDSSNNGVSNSPVCKDFKKNKGNPTLRIINTAANLLALVGGLVAIIMLIVGGLNLVTAGGSFGNQYTGTPGKIKEARGRINTALVGLAIIALAWTIIRFVVDKFVR